MFLRASSSGGVWIDSRLEEPTVGVFGAFVSAYRTVPGWYFKLDHARFLPHPSGSLSCHDYRCSCRYSPIVRYAASTLRLQDMRTDCVSRDSWQAECQLRVSKPQNGTRTRRLGYIIEMLQFKPGERKDGIPSCLRDFKCTGIKETLTGIGWLPLSSLFGRHTYVD